MKIFTALVRTIYSSTHRHGRDRHDGADPTDGGTVSARHQRHELILADRAFRQKCRRAYAKLHSFSKPLA